MGAGILSAVHRDQGHIEHEAAPGPGHYAEIGSAGEYVKNQAHTNGIESLWALLKRGYIGTYHKMRVKHLSRYVNEFAGRHNQRPLDTAVQMECMARGLMNKRLRYKDLIQG